MKHLGIPRALVSLACVMAVGCGGNLTSNAEPPADGGGSTSVTGSAAGQPIPTTSTVAFFEGPGSVVIGMSSVEDACDKWQAGGGNEPGLRTFGLGITAGMRPLTPGTFFIGWKESQQPPYANASYASFDDSCRQTNLIEAESGSVVLQTVSASGAAGTFDVTLTTGERVSGTFSAPACKNSRPVDAGPPPCGQ
jgi:hypothetical protein